MAIKSKEKYEHKDTVHANWKPLDPHCPIVDPKTREEVQQMILYKITLGYYEKRFESSKMMSKYKEARKLYYDRYQKEEVRQKYEEKKKAVYKERYKNRYKNKYKKTKE